MAILAAQYDAVLFDLDGVLTPTAKIHAVCWKRLFDNFLRQYSRAAGCPFQPFDIQQDYKLYVDGKPRYEGIKSFLASRKIDLPYGDKASDPDEMTVLELGSRKDKYFEETLQAEGIAPYGDVVSVVQHLRAQGLKTAVVSSSRNCKMVLAAADISDLFDSIMDGELAEQLHLAGKPEPDTFLEAAKQVGAVAKRSVVVEDSIAGVQAGRKGEFGWVVGVAHDGDASALAKNGADIVIGNLSELLS
jgi:beta-phosphoglucomutase family hydrolase